MFSSDPEVNVNVYDENTNDNVLNSDKYWSDPNWLFNSGTVTTLHRMELKHNEDQVTSIQKISDIGDRIVHIHLRGEKFTTLYSTLRQSKMLMDLLNYPYDNIFIDQSAELFEFVLQFLRDSTQYSVLHANIQLWNKIRNSKELIHNLKLEFEYYQIPLDII